MDFNLSEFIQDEKFPETQPCKRSRVDYKAHAATLQPCDEDISPKFCCWDDSSGYFTITPSQLSTKFVERDYYSVKLDGLRTRVEESTVMVKHTANILQYGLLSEVKLDPELLKEPCWVQTSDSLYTDVYTYTLLEA